MLSIQPKYNCTYLLDFFPFTVQFFLILLLFVYLVYLLRSEVKQNNSILLPLILSGAAGLYHSYLRFKGICVLDTYQLALGGFLVNFNNADILIVICSAYLVLYIYNAGRKKTSSLD